MSDYTPTKPDMRGSAESRRRRREWLVITFRANVDVDSLLGGEIALGFGLAACRCYRCGILLTVDTLTVDRIIPGCLGGTYRRDNIRPACAKCNYSEGAKLRGGKWKK